MNNDSLTVLKLFTRKLANCRHKVTPEAVTEYMNKGRFGYTCEEGKEIVVTNDSVFADDMSMAVRHIRNIFKKPHIFLKKEGIIQNVSIASKFDNVSIMEDYKDAKLWKLKDDGEIAPEFVHTYVHEDNLAIYENRFVVALVDVLYKLIDKKVTELYSKVNTLNGKITGNPHMLGIKHKVYVNYVDETGIPVLENNDDVNISIIVSLLKDKRTLQSFMHRDLYVACKRAGKFDLHNVKMTNIFQYDDDYNFCYEFYSKYLSKDPIITTESRMYFGFATVNLIDALISCGFNPESENEYIYVNNSASLRFDDGIRFVKAPFEATLFITEEASQLLLIIKNTVDGDEGKYLFNIVSKAVKRNVRGFTTPDEYALKLRTERPEDVARNYLVTDVGDGTQENLIYVEPNRSDVKEKLMFTIKSATILVEASTFIHVKFCPVCGSNMVTLSDANSTDYFCRNCEALYHPFVYDDKELIWIKRLPTAEKDEEEVLEDAAATQDTTDVSSDELLASYSEYNETTGIRKSFLAKIIQGSWENQNYYNELKNYILQYKKVNSRVSWNYDSFNLGREKMVKIAVRGKTLVAFFALSVSDYEDSKYFPHYMGDVKKFEETPMMIKVKSDRGVKHAKELIDTLFAAVPKKKDFVETDYRMAYKTDDKLVEEGLAKYVTITTNGAGFPTVSAYNGEDFEEETAPETVKETAAVEDTAATETEEIAEEEEKTGLKRSFEAKIIQGGDENQGYYNELKNYILRYKKVSSRVSWNYDSFNLGREKKIKIAVRGKTLVVFFALDIDAYAESKYYPHFMGGVKKFEETPMMIKVKSDRGVNHAKELIDAVLEGVDLKKDFVPEDYTRPYQDDEELIKEGLAKTVTINI